MKWTDLESRLKKMIGVSADTEIAPEEILTKLDSMINAASTVLEEKDTVLEISEKLDQQISEFETVLQTLADHKGSIEELVEKVDNLETATDEKLTSLTKSIITKKTDKLSLESLKVNRDKTIEGKDEDGPITADVNLMLNAKNKQSWQRL